MTFFGRDLVLRRALDKQWLSPGQLETARTELKRQPEAAGSTLELIRRLVANGALTPRQVAELQAEVLGLDVLEPDPAKISPEVLALVAREFARRHALLPIDRRAGVMRVAVCDPFETDGTDSLAHLLGCEISTGVVPEDVFESVFTILYGPAKVPTAGAHEESYGERPESMTARAGVAEDENDAPVIQLVQGFIAEALARRASDIHLEPLAGRFRVRYRVDGLLVDAGGPPRALHPAVISRVKIMANLSIAEKRLPQDGRIQLSGQGRAIDLRVASLPTVHGETMVLRVLDRAARQPGLDDLGLAAGDRSTLERLICLPDGIVLVTGPTGSGKTTTLYGCLQHLNQPDRKIITVEDPVEYQLTGINQVPVRTETGMTFAAALRAMLRQAPNGVRVGEIRDLETAEIALHASLTGHMVFSTLHTNDAPGAVARMADLGVKPFLLAASLRAVVAQRLVRKVCRQCGERYRPGPAEWQGLGLAGLPPREVEFTRGPGCLACQGTGYHGRIGLFEIFLINEAVQQVIHERVSPVRLRGMARAQGLGTLRADGIRKVSAGLTTSEEVVSMTPGDS